ncbi:hypothetical protein CHS0354_015596 [Potamilus streckersoni]|uniref:Alpha-type protein kinase domain-containing protein n=1 Tax=Potamilus streckersoni TaxID=2493646 RepID=A0AAE0TBN8_9BIVA|nr:hypothetical protein CHS0354_015596 [Potamilus streckersoni]
MGSSYSHETYYSRNHDRDGTTYKATYESQPFNQGTSRYAFKGILDGKGPRKGDACVTKVFKKEFAKNFDQWVPDLAASEKALKFAQKFNLDCIPILSKTKKEKYKQIDFLIPLIAKMYDVSHYKLFGFIPINRDESLVRLEEYVAIEPFLEGQYKKFNSNGGYEDAIHDLMLAFSHWTWSISGHKFMVCDLQGIETKRKYVLTDPAVHSLEEIYGMTDLGVVGMEMVLANHNCNGLCRKLGLENPVADEGVLIPTRNTRSTTYSFQLSKEEKLRALKRQNRYFEILPAIFE